MMPLQMPFSPSAHTSLPKSVVPSCQHSNHTGWPARRQHTSLMRRKVELARQGFRLLEMQSHVGTHGVPPAWSDAHQAYRGSDRQVRCASSRSSGETLWEAKRKSDRDKQEAARRMQPTSRYVNTSSGLAAYKHSLVGPATMAEPREAYARANPHDAAQPSNELPQATMPVVNWHSPQEPATAPQPCQADELTETAASQQDNLPSVPFSQLSLNKVKIAWLLHQSTNCACHVCYICKRSRSPRIKLPVMLLSTASKSYSMNVALGPFQSSLSSQLLLAAAG